MVVQPSSPTPSKLPDYGINRRSKTHKQCKTHKKKSHLINFTMYRDSSSLIEKMPLPHHQLEEHGSGCSLGMLQQSSISTYSTYTCKSYQQQHAHIHAQSSGNGSRNGSRMCRLSALLTMVLIMLVADADNANHHLFGVNGEVWDYGVVMDAGSQGTRVYIYRW
jgi:hypothetical protein